MEVIKFTANKTPYACWDWELARKNLEFLEGIDPDYFTYIAEINAEHLQNEGKHRAALSLRLAYSQGLETLFALLCSLIQAPQCVVGWMSVYKTHELQELTRSIIKGQPVYSRFIFKSVTWELVSKEVLRYRTYEKGKTEWIQEGFEKLWARFANDFTNTKITQEYNCAKHGLRTRPGGFSISIGKEETPGVPAPPEAMQSLGGSAFGTSYFTVEKIIEDQRLNFRPRRQARNWNPENLIYGLLLLSMSMKNVISYLKIFNGIQPNSCRFWNPDTKETFDLPWRNEVWVHESSMDTMINKDDIGLFTKEDVINSYE